jgi:isopropylmalate/homocitrate/citramalate synthase
VNSSRLPGPVKLVEVGPRDGLQNEATPIPTEMKVAFIRKLAEAGCAEIEVTSFVHPRRVPQLADAEAVIDGCRDLIQRGSPTLTALVPNERGLARALAAGITRIALFTAASETFTDKNIDMSIAESLQRFAPVARDALAAGLTVRGYVSTCFVCPYEGEIAPEPVLRVAAALLEMGVDEVSLGDTVGAAVPTDVYRLLDLLLTQLPRERLALHFHDTSGTALANVLAALERGITTFDSSAGGLGGCPYAPGAAGNLATEDLIYMLNRMGISNGISLPHIAAATALLEPHLPHPLPSKQYQRLKSRGDLSAETQRTQRGADP